MLCSCKMNEISQELRGAQRVDPLAGWPRAFTLIELLVVVAIIGLLASLLLPALARAKQTSQRAACLSNLKQIGVAFAIYLEEAEDRFPDRRDLKSSLPGGYKPWTTWPASDPRTGWAPSLLEECGAGRAIWSCTASLNTVAGNAPQTIQVTEDATKSGLTRYWAWRFDRLDNPVPLTDFWSKTQSQAVADLQAAKDPNVGPVNGPCDVELVVDAYFPKTVGSLPPELSGRAVHPGGRNRLSLDGHAQYLTDTRTPW